MQCEYEVRDLIYIQATFKDWIINVGIYLNKN